jgi:hypothetical protein
MIKVSSLNVSLVISLVVIILLFVYVYNKYQTKEDYDRIQAGVTDIPGGAQIQVKYILEDDKVGVFSTMDRAPNGRKNDNVNKELQDYVIYTGIVNAESSDVKWTKMELYKWNGTAPINTWFPDPSNPVWNAEWFGSGLVPPTKPVRFPTFAQLKSGEQPARKWPNGEQVIGNHGMKKDTCMGILEMNQTGVWFCPAELKFTVGSGTKWYKGF